MKFGFLVTFVITVIVAALIGIMWAFFTAPDSTASENEGFRDLMSSERAAISSSQSHQHSD